MCLPSRSRITWIFFTSANVVNPPALDERLQNGHSRNQRKRARAKHFAHHKDALAVDRRDDDGDLRLR